MSVTLTYFEKKGSVNSPAAATASTEKYAESNDTDSR